MSIMKNFILVVFLFAFAKMSYTQTGWQLQSNPIAPSNSNTLGKIQFVSSTEGWISAADGNLLHTTDAGATWNIVTPFPNDTVSSIADPSISMCWINQTHGWKMNWFGTGFGDARGAVIQQTTDGGTTWTKKVLSTTPGDAGLQVQFVDENNGWAMIYNFNSNTAKFIRTTDGGGTWNSFNGKGIFYFVDANNGWALGSAGSQDNPPNNIYRTTNGGTDWAEQYTDNTNGGYNAIQFTDLNNGWIVGDSSKILKTTDGGNNWLRVTNAGINSESKNRCVFFLDANTGWIGTDNGNVNNNPPRVILYTKDGGATWTKQFPPVTNSIFSIFFRDNNNGWFTADNCVQNCNEPDSLKIWQGAICHTTGGGITGVNGENNSTPANYTLLQNYPNPFNPATTISYSIPKAGFVTIQVYNILGKEIKTLVNEKKDKGNYQVQFNADKLANGIYFYRMQAGSFIETKKLILLK